MFVKKNIVLIIGQNKNNNYFKKSIEIYLSRRDIFKVILVTWKLTDIDFVKPIESIEKILVSEKKFELSCQYQKHLYDIGIKYINNNYKEDNIFILKTRMDLIINDNQLDYLFSQEYKINLQKDTLFSYKIWIPWAHVTMPLWVEDACFYSHISVMNNLSPYTENFIQQPGNSHIRWFYLLAKEYELYNDNKLYHHYNSMNSKFVLNEINKDILIKYRECIKDHFIIKTLEDGILFRKWNDINFYKKPSVNIIDIIDKKHTTSGTGNISKLKIVYNNEDFFNINM